MLPIRRCAGAIAIVVLAPCFCVAQVEGPLDNDSYLPVDVDAEAELARGDQAFALARSAAASDGSAAARAATWTPTCEAWRNALVRSRVGASSNPRPLDNPADSSPWPAPEGKVERYTEGVEEAVFRRLAALPKPGQTLWGERFTPLAQQELERAGGSPAELARIERELPATAGAARAALLLAEIAFERGDADSSRRWLARARRHAAAFGVEDSALRSGIDRREKLLPTAPPTSSSSWAGAATLEFVAGHDLEVQRGPAQRTRPLGAGPQAGLAFLDGERVLLQTPAAIWLLSGAKAQVLGPFENEAWLRPASLEVAPTAAPGNAPGWRLDPAAKGPCAVLVAGRTQGTAPNVLARIDVSAADGEPKLRWAVAAAATPTADPTSEPGQEYEFQPGPLWTEGTVIVLVRRSTAASGAGELELRALEPESGALRWSTYLGNGGERVRDAGRFARRAALPMPAEPLALTAGGIFASAQLGFAAMLDPLDGRARFAVRNHRHDGAERGWTGWGSAQGGEGKCIAWAPADADYLYLLDSAGPGQRGTPWSAAPEAMGEAEALVDADARGALVISRSGARQGLSQWELGSGSRIDGFHLAPLESFSGRALASPKRVLAASDRALYLLDRNADLALLASASLGGPVPRGGNVWAGDARVFVLSSRYVQVFQTR